MINDAYPHPKKTKLDWQKIVSDWKESKLPKATFCQLHGIPKSGLYAHLEKSDSANSKFIRAALSKPVVKNDSIIDITLPNGIRVKMSEYLPALIEKIFSL